MNRNLRLALPIASVLAWGVIAVTSAPAAYAYDENSTASINVERGVALKGHDPVAYFTQGKATPGSARYVATHAGATYQFASVANQQAFLANPAKYAPQYGGFCAMGAALGKKLDVDPTVFKVVDGKLYLNVNADVFQKWSEDVPGHIKTANQNWPAIADQAPSAL